MRERRIGYSPGPPLLSNGLCNTASSCPSSACCYGPAFILKGHLYVGGGAERPEIRPVYLAVPVGVRDCGGRVVVDAVVVLVLGDRHVGFARTLVEEGVFNYPGRPHLGLAGYDIRRGSIRRFRYTQAVARDLLAPGLSLVFCGYNPSLSAGHTYHYAHPSNRFWSLLYESGITERLYEPEEDELLLEIGMGFTNLAPRPTRRAEDLSREEFRAGSLQLRGKLQRYSPRAVAYTGIGVYRWLRATTKVRCGVQDTSAVAGVTDVVIPSPSGLNRMRFEELVEYYRALVPFLA